MRAVVALATREVVRFFRQPSRVVGAIFPPLLMWVLVGSGFATSLNVSGGGAASSASNFAYFFPGTIVLVILFASIFATISVIEDRREGFLQGVIVSPVSPLSIVFGKVLGAAILGMLQGGLLLVLVPLLGLAYDAGALVQAVLVLALVSVALAGLGFTIAWSLESVQGFHSVMNLFLMPMWLLSGSFFPVGGASPWLQTIMALNPLTYGVAALRRGLSPASATGLPSFGTSVLVTALFGVVTVVLSAIVVARNPSGPAGRVGKPAIKARPHEAPVPGR